MTTEPYIRDYLHFPYEKLDIPDDKKELLQIPIPLTAKQTLIFDAFHMEDGKQAEEAKLKPLSEGKVEPSVIALRKLKGGEEAESKMSTKQMPKITIHKYEDGHTQDVSVLIPEDVFAGNTEGDYPIHVRFHGGGFGTGAPDFRMWFPYHVRHLAVETRSVTLWPGYRKMPEHQGKDILADVDRFWEWYQSPDFEVKMRKLCPNMKGKFLRDELLVSGDSAGGFLATHSWLSQPKLHIKAMYLQYPMLRAYTRHRVDPYRGVELEKKHFYGVADRIHGKMKEMKDNGTLKSRTDSIPPLGMDLAYTLSSATKEVMWNQKPATISHWRFRFQELDILERVEALVGTGITDTTITTLLEQVMQKLPPPKSVSDLPVYQPQPPAKLEKPVYCPPIFITHGKNDTQVPWEDTVWFVEHVRALLPEQARICPFYVPGEGHGFDYMVEHYRKERRWLGKMMMMIATDWLPSGSEELSLEGKPPASNGQNGITFDDLPDDDIKEAEVGVAQILADFHSNYKQYEKTARAALRKELEDEIKAKKKADPQKS